jgi:hypothetical protein
MIEFLLLLKNNWKAIVGVLAVSLVLCVYFYQKNQILDLKGDIIKLEQEKDTITKDFKKCIDITNNNDSYIKECVSENNKCRIDLSKCYAECDIRIQYELSRILKEKDISLKSCNDKLNICLTTERCMSCPKCEDISKEECSKNKIELDDCKKALDILNDLNWR